MGLISRVLANGLWLSSSLPEAVRFRRACRDVAHTQAHVLHGIISANGSSAFGRRHNFASLRSPHDFQAAVSLCDYESLYPLIARAAAGETGVLTTAPIQLFEPTSGSTTTAKLIPYTAALKQEFQRAIAPWAVDTFLRYPALLRGSHYWSISPVGERRTRTAGGIPVGFEEDSDYLGGRLARLVDGVMAVPGAVKEIAHMETFRYVTLLFLLRSPALAFVSIWNPTFLTLLMEPLPVWLPRLADDLAAGRISPPASLPSGLHARLAGQLRPDPRRALAIRRLAENADSPAALHAALWPRLRVISCWADAQAAPYAGQLAALFPQADLQPKGLLATEGFVSLPLGGRGGAVLAIRSHFFEFQPEGTDDCMPLLAHQLDVGGRYAVILTTGGGLYRYRLNDLVEVTGKEGDLPRLRFLGKADLVSDWFGEKLHAVQVEAALTPLLEQYAVESAFLLVACDIHGRPPGYRLYLEPTADRSVDNATLAAIAAGMEQALNANVHYAYCRRLGQLGPFACQRISAGAARYQQICIGRGQRAGDIKPALLDRGGDWSEILMMERG